MENNLRVYLHILGHNKFAFPLGSNKNIFKMLEVPSTVWDNQTKKLHHKEI
jgi:hypothetical protein